MNQNRRAFLQQISFATAGLGLLPFLPGCRTTGLAGHARGLPRSAPEAQGVSSEGIQAFLDSIAQSKHEFHSFMLVRRGHVVAEGWWNPYAPELNHRMYSMSKSFTSTALGFAIAEGKLRVSDPVISFFPDDLPPAPSENLKAMRLKDLLTMATGHAQEPTWEMIKTDNWPRAFLGWPVPNQPGSNFLYNSGATYMVSAITQRVTGQRILDYLTPRLFEPLGIEGATWDTCPRGINVGGWGLNIRTEGLAKLGQLYLQKGQWNGRQLLPESWIADATSRQVQQPLPSSPSRPNERNDWVQGYGYQFWRSTHNSYRGDGAFGQYTLVMPEQDAVLAITSESPNMQAELDLVWQHLLPAMQPGTLPANRIAHARLQERLASLNLKAAEGTYSSAAARRVTDRTFKLEPNDLGLVSGTFTFGKDFTRFILRDGKAAYPFQCGHGKWLIGETALPGTPPDLVSIPPRPGTKSKVAASAAWRDEDTLDILLRYHETPHHDRVTCRFRNNLVEVSFMNSIAAMSANPKDKRPVLRGRFVAPQEPVKRKRKKDLF